MYDWRLHRVVMWRQIEDPYVKTNQGSLCKYESRIPSREDPRNEIFCIDLLDNHVLLFFIEIHQSRPDREWLSSRSMQNLQLRGSSRDRILDSYSHKDPRFVFTKGSSIRLVINILEASLDDPRFVFTSRSYSKWLEKYLILAPEQINKSSSFHLLLVKADDPWFKSCNGIIFCQHVIRKWKMVNLSFNDDQTASMVL
jgi:hypothetical protein